MKVNVKKPQTKKNRILWILGCLIIVLGIVASQEMLSLQTPLLRWGSLVVALIIAFVCFYFTSQRHRFWIFLLEANVELRKVTWPTRSETIRTTALVIVVVIIASLFLWGVDSLLLWLISFLTG